MPDRYVPRTGADYGRAFASLLPRGAAWPRAIGSVLTRTLRGLAEHLGRFDGRADDLLRREADPRFTAEMLTDWERVAGLPDPCFPATLTLAERRAALVARLTARGGQSKAYFLSLAKTLGYHTDVPNGLQLPFQVPAQVHGSLITQIREFSPFMCGVSRCGDPLWQVGHMTMRFYWEVIVPGARTTWFRCGGDGGRCGQDPHVRIARAEDLECVFRRYKPAQTEIIFNYAGAA